jgi:hypothetical protein
MAHSPVDAPPLLFYLFEERAKLCIDHLYSLSLSYRGALTTCWQRSSFIRISSKHATTKQGGMDEDKAALLAELQAISQKSAASHFDDYNSNNDEKKNNTEDSKEATAAMSSSFSLAHLVKSDKNVND